MHHINTVSTQNDLQILQGKQKDLEIDIQQQQKHLIEALLAKDKFAKELEALKGDTTSLEGLKQVSARVLPSLDSSDGLRQRKILFPMTEDADLHAELKAVGMGQDCATR